MLINPNCLRCGAPFTADLPDWMPTATCDRCAEALLAYAVKGLDIKHTANRIKATRRLYAKATAPVEVPALPCEVDFTPQTAPAYDGVAPTHIDPMYEAVAAGEREAAARFRADRNALGFDG